MVDGQPVDAEELLRQADIAMYRGKREGRNKVVIFEPSMEQAVIARAELEAELRRGIRSRAIYAVFQPVVDLRTGTVTSVEALARWTSATQGPIAPTRFVELAEQMNMVAELDLAMIESSCRLIRDVVDPVTLRPVSLSVNLSPQHLDHLDVVDGLLTVLHDEDFPAGAAHRRGHRDRGDARSGRCRQPHPASSASTASASRSTTSAPATRRSPTSSSSRSTT